MKCNLLCSLLKIAFLFRNRKQQNPQKLWKIKLKKYYEPLFRYHRQYTIFQNNKLNSCILYRHLLLDELKKEVTLIPRLAVIITTRCTLRCKKCAGLFPYFAEKQDIAYQNIIKSMKAVEKKTDYIYCLELVGGESFLLLFANTAILKINVSKGENKLTIKPNK